MSYRFFKEITSATSDRREYSDKSLDYYQNFMMLLVIMLILW